MNLRLSKSKVLEFEQCPHRYKLMQIDKAIKVTQNEAMQRGGEIHDLAEELHKNPSEDYQAKIDRIKQHKYYDKHNIAVKRLVAFDLKRGIPKIINTEEKIYDDDLNITGIYDRVDTENNKLILWDYKTGKAHPINKFRFELALYTYLYEKTHKQKIDFWGIYFIDQNIQELEPRKETEIIKTIEKVNRTRQEIRKRIESGKWEKIPSYLCRWCPVFLEGKCDGEN